MREREKERAKGCRVQYGEKEERGKRNGGNMHAIKTETQTETDLLFSLLKEPRRVHARFALDNQQEGCGEREKRRPVRGQAGCRFSRSKRATRRERERRRDETRWQNKYRLGEGCKTHAHEEGGGGTWTSGETHILAVGVCVHARYRLEKRRETRGEREKRREEKRRRRRGGNRDALWSEREGRAAGRRRGRES